MTKIPINVRKPLKYESKQNVVRMTKIPINVSRPLKYDSKQNVVRMTKIPIKVSRPLKYDSQQNVTFCLWSYFKGLLTFIGIFVILTTFC
jgi:hypothetical protein